LFIYCIIYTHIESFIITNTATELNGVCCPWWYCYRLQVEFLSPTHCPRNLQYMPTLKQSA